MIIRSEDCYGLMDKSLQLKLFTGHSTLVIIRHFLMTVIGLYYVIMKVVYQKTTAAVAANATVMGSSGGDRSSSA